MENFLISTTLKKNKYKPKKDWAKIKDSYLGKAYDLSIVFIGDKFSKKINNLYRGKNYPTNILSFPLSKKSGEIFINIPICKKQYKKFDRKFDDFLDFLFIHGLVHLAGFDHRTEKKAEVMEKEEIKLRKKFNI